MPSEHYNRLTPAEAERLAMLAEECAEVIQIIGKIQRHGYESHHPNDPTDVTNRRMLEKEIRDVLGVHLAMVREGDIASPENIEKTAEISWTRKLKYTHHQGE